jgi:hypothetical protein
MSEPRRKEKGEGLNALPLFLFVIAAVSVELPELNLATAQIRAVEADELSAAKVVESIHIIAAQIVWQRDRQSAGIVDVDRKEPIPPIDLPDGSLKKLHVR